LVEIALACSNILSWDGYFGKFAPIIFEEEHHKKLHSWDCDTEGFLVADNYYKKVRQCHHNEEIVFCPEILHTKVGCSCSEKSPKWIFVEIHHYCIQLGTHSSQLENAKDEHECLSTKQGSKMIVKQLKKNSV
jgi:hypothetical protein